MRAVVIGAGVAVAAALAAVYVSGRGPDNGTSAATSVPVKKLAAAPGAAIELKTGATTGKAKPERFNMGKVAAFVYKSEPEPLPQFPFFNASQQTTTIDAFKGKVILLNLWATWCGPCREEMPSLDRLQKTMGSEKFEVVAISVDKNGFDKAKDFLKDNSVTALNFYSDPSARAASKVKAIGMPATLLVDPEGREIGRLMGPAEWDSPDAKRLIEAHLR